MSRRHAAAALGLLVALAAPSFAASQTLVRSEDAVVALFSLQTELEVDGRLLVRIEERHEKNREARLLARGLVVRLYSRLDDLFAHYRTALHAGARRDSQEEDPAGEREGAGDDEKIEAEIEEVEAELLAAERAETAVQDEGRRLRSDIRNLRERMTILSQRIVSLQSSLPTQRESVTGVWDVSLLPSGDRGVFALFQSGTIVTGQYVLDGPFQGSLEGTLVDRRILLHRIDARLGRSMDLSAFLAPDGQQMQGTWENYDLANGQARTGSWSARRRQPRTPGTGEDLEGGP